jgi:putative DNA primase/helicase
MPDPNNIPAAMQVIPQWILHKDKVPIDPHTGKAAKATDPRTWGEFALVRGKENIGFELLGYIGIDFDHITKYDTSFCKWARAWVERFARVTFTETSPSGNGKHVIGTGSFVLEAVNAKEIMDYESPLVPRGKTSVHDANVMVVTPHYDTQKVIIGGRYFTVTGKAYNEKQLAPAEITELVKQFYKELLEWPEKQKMLIAAESKSVPEKLKAVPPPQPESLSPVPTEGSPKKHVRQAFQDILDGTLKIEHGPNKQTHIQEFRYWSACWREWLNCGLTQEEVFSKLHQAQPSFQEDETLKQLKYLKNKDHRPSQKLYNTLFPNYCKTNAIEKVSSTEQFWWDCITTDSTPADIDKMLVRCIDLMPLIQDACIKHISKTKSIAQPVLKAQLKALREHRHAEEKEKDAEEKEKDAEEKEKEKTEKPPPIPLTLEEQKIADIDLLKKEPITWLKKTLDLIIIGNDHQKVTLALLFPAGNPLGFVIQSAVLGPSGAGKTWLVSGTILLAPEEDRDIVAASTGAALRDLLEECKDTRKILFLQEKEGVSEDDSIANLIIRVLSADDKGGRVLLMDNSGGKWSLREVQLAQNISFITTFAGGTVAHQNETRMWLISSDADKKYVNKVIKKGVFQDIFEKQDALEIFTLRSRVWQEIITPLLVSLAQDAVIIPYLNILSSMFEDVPTSEPTIRDAKKFRILIEIITKLHAALAPDTRAFITKNDLRYWIAEYTDFALACEVAGSLIQTNRLRLNDTQIKLYTALLQLEKDQVLDNEKGFSNPDIAKKAGVPPDYARRLIANLKTKGYIEAKSETKDGKAKGYKTSGLNIEVNKEWGVCFKNSVRFEVTNYFGKSGVTKPPAELYSIFDGFIEEQPAPSPKKPEPKVLPAPTGLDKNFTFEKEILAPDIDTLMTGHARSKVGHLVIVLEMLRDMEEENGNKPVEVDTLKERIALDGNLKDEEVEETLKTLKKEGSIIYTKDGLVKSVKQT